MTEAIPQPRGLPIIGNILDLQDEVPVHALERIADVYGPIFKLNIFGKERIIVTDAELMQEVCDEGRFNKKRGDGAASLTAKAKAQGLFTAPSEEDMDWQQAHRTLIPAFGPLSIANMFDEMADIASQLVLKWARKGPDYRIPVTNDMTRVTLDSIALCAMDFRFNSFYQDEMHPFITAMNSTLTASSNRLQLFYVLKSYLPWDKTAEKVAADGKYQRETALELVQHRRDHPTEKKDLLNAMIHGKDPKTGETMRDELIAANMITFLIAGHETTSGLLSFAFLLLLKNPSAYFAAQQEVDRVVGKGKVTASHLKDLKYMNAVLRETLRLNPTVPAFSRGVRPDSKEEHTIIGQGKYAIKKDDSITCLICKSQKDPKVFGEDAQEFRPERMLDENFSKLPRGSWQPFGTGVRSCIGRAFAWQEALLVAAMLLQNFNFRLNDPAYEFKVKQTLTIKPDNFFMRATLREGITATSLQAALTTSPDVKPVLGGRHDSATVTPATNVGKMTILYGSNTGTCQSLAQKLSIDAQRHGYQASVQDLDSAVGNLPKDQPIVLISASYEGQPPDNAAQFVAYLESLDEQVKLDGVQYAVFGCGHSDWSATFQRIPTLIDDHLSAHGAKRIAVRGSSDAAQGDMFTDFDTYLDDTFWPAMDKMHGASPPSAGGSEKVLEVELSTQDRASHLRQDVAQGIVIDAKRLTSPDQPEKRHLEIQLPTSMTYQTGDYLAILPLNPEANVSRVLRHYSIPWDAHMTVKPGAATFLPTGVPMSVADLLKGYVELSSPATKKNMHALVAATDDPVQKAQLEIFAEESFYKDVVEQRVSVLDLVERYPAVKVSFSSFLEMLPPLRPRHYSISSSSLHDPATCTITYGVISEASRSGNGEFVGVTGTYLRSLKPGDPIQVSVRSTNKFFHLPVDTASTPIMMFGAGTGIAPFRGFIQERAVQIKAGQKSLAPAVLFLGCRSESKDRLYAEEIDAWADRGAVDIKYAFSKESEKSAGCRYVQDRMLKEKEQILRLWQDGAKVFVCGGPALVDEVSTAARTLLAEQAAQHGQQVSAEEAKDWFKQRRNERFVVDVFA